MKTTILASSLLAVSLAFTGPAMAEQETRTAPATAQQPALPDASDFSTEQLEAFVSTQKEMGQIQQKYARKLQAKQDKPQEAMEVRKEAQQALATAVKESGLEIKTYNQIARLAQSDQAFRSKLQAML